MVVYDLYGFDGDDIDEARTVLEEALDIHFEVRDSHYQAGRYFKYGKSSDEHFILKRNIDPLDGELAEMSFPTHKVLFYLNETTRSADLQRRLFQKSDRFFLLRHEDFE